MVFIVLFVNRYATAYFLCIMTERLDGEFQLLVVLVLSGVWKLSGQKSHVMRNTCRARTPARGRMRGPS